MKIFYSMLFVLLVVSCDNDENEIDEHKWDAVVSDYLSKYESVKDKASFIFFTDPHLLSSNNNFSNEVKSKIESSILPMKELYSLLPINFCLCGGDWLNSRDTQVIAKQKILFADQQMKALFPKYYKMLGNHDTNYLGYISSESLERGDFSRSFINNKYFSDTKSAFYSFEDQNTRFFILDSGLDIESNIIDDYKKEQLLWLTTQLEKNKSRHLIIGIHMFYDATITSMSNEIVNICNAYNTKKEITLFDNKIDFTNASGIIHLILTGHRHTDTIDYEKDIPIVGTCRYIQDGTPCFDICLLNYDNGYLLMKRVGLGEDRYIKLYQ